MKMGSKEAVEYIKPEGEIYTCPTCGYTDGFHVSFDINKDSGTGDVVLICPACHVRFRLGWSVKID